VYTRNGVPLFYPTCFALSHLRNSGQASATIEQALRSVMALQLILDRSKIDLFSRLNEGRIPDVDRDRTDELKSLRTANQKSKGKNG
jgi:hypothetical protein